jgi:hypothetical protein
VIIATSAPADPIGAVEIVIALLMAPLGVGIGIWFTRVFWMDASTGQPTPLWNRIQAGVLFFLSGSVPGAIQTFLASNKESGVLTMACLIGFYGFGLILGYFLPQRFVATDVFASALSSRILGGAGRPTPVEVFAFTTKFGSKRACSLLHLSDDELDHLFKIGIDQFSAVIPTLSSLESSIVLEVLCGVPITQTARDFGRSTDQVVAVLKKAFP